MERLVKDLGKECKWRQVAKWSLMRKSLMAVLKSCCSLWGNWSKQYYLAQIPPSKGCEGLGMWIAFQSVTVDGKQQKAGEALHLSKGWAPWPEIFTEKWKWSTFLYSSLTLNIYKYIYLYILHIHIYAYFILYIHIYTYFIYYIYTPSPLLTTSKLAHGTVSICCAYFLLGCKDSVLISFPSQKNWQGTQTQKTELKGCCASPKPIIKHRFDSIIHVLWWTTHK